MWDWIFFIDINDILQQIESRSRYENNELSEKEINNPIYNSIKNYKILRGKFNQGGERAVH